MQFDFYVHGLWLIGGVSLFLGALIAGNVEFVEGTTPWSFGLAVLISLLLILFAGVCWISSSVNAKPEQR
jgi:hypothetical protein